MNFLDEFTQAAWSIWMKLRSDMLNGEILIPAAFRQRLSNLESQMALPGIWMDDHIKNAPKGKLWDLAQKAYTS